MRKIYAIVSFLFMGILSYAQPLTKQWTALAGESFEWFTTNNNVRGMDYNAATNNLLVSDMNNNVYILNSGDGALIGTLSRTGLGSEGFKHIRIRITADGVIYGISLATGAGNCTIYRWANETANPTIAAVFAVDTRTGDALGISGTGNNTIIYASGAGTFENNAVVYLLTTPNGIQFVKESIIKIPSSNAQWANRTVEPVTNSRTSDLWIKTSFGDARRITVGENVGGVRTGTVAGTTPNTIPVGGFSALRHFTTNNNKKFLAFAASANTSVGSNYQAAFMRVYDVTDETNVTLYGIDSLYDNPADGVKSNGNGTGDVAVKEEENGEFTIFWMSTNNGIQATKTGLQILPVTMGPLNAELVNKTARLSWTTASENNNKGFQVERSANGTDFQSIGFVASKGLDGNSKLPLDYQFEDRQLNKGRNFYRLQQMDKDGKTTYTEVKMVQNIATGSFAAQLRTNPMVNELSLNVFMSEAGKVGVTLINATGATVNNKEQMLLKGENLITMPASNLAKGVYFVTIRDANNPENVTTLRVIK